jgi:hypothetical protein
MKTTSKELLETVSKHCYNQLTFYRFNTTTLQVSDKYREGRLTALEYLTELSYYYLQEEKSIEKQFKEQIIRQLTRYSCLDDTEYKRGLYDALNEVLHL